MRILQPAGCSSVPSYHRDRQREGPSADPAQRCPAGLGEAQIRFTVGNGECAFLSQRPSAGHKLQPRVQALSIHKKPLRFNVRGAGANLPVPLNERVSAQSSKRQCFHSFHAQQKLSLLIQANKNVFDSTLIQANENVFDSFLIQANDNVFDSSLIQANEKVCPLIIQFSNVSRWVNIRVHSFSAGVRPWSAKLVSGWLAPASYSSDG